MKDQKQINQLKRLKTLRLMHNGELLKCNSLDKQIKNIEKNKRIN